MDRNLRTRILTTELHIMLETEKPKCTTIGDLVKETKRELFSNVGKFQLYGQEKKKMWNVTGYY